MQRICHTPSFRVYTNADVVGCELAGRRRTSSPSAVGMAVGLGFGANATASLITRGLAETSQLGRRARGRPVHVRRAGRARRPRRHLPVAAVAQPDVRRGARPGRSVAEISHATRQVAEGVLSCASVQQLAREHDVGCRSSTTSPPSIAGELAPAEAVRALMSRAPGRERVASSEPARAVPESTPRPSSMQPSERVERTLQVGPEVVGVLDTDGHPDQALGDDVELAAPAAAALEGGLDAAQAGRVGPQVQPSTNRSAVGPSASSIDSSEPKPSIVAAARAWPSSSGSPG